MTIKLNTHADFLFLQCQVCLFFGYACLCQSLPIRLLSAPSWLRPTVRMSRVPFVPLWVSLLCLAMASSVDGHECWDLLATKLKVPVYDGCALKIGVHVYIVGGNTEAGNAGSELWTITDLDDNLEWTANSQYLPFVVSGPSSCAVDQAFNLYVSRAASTNNGHENFLWVLTTDQSSKQKWVGEPYSPGKRQLAGLLAYGDSLYLFGGVDDNNQFQQAVEAFNTTTSTWNSDFAYMSAVDTSQEGFCNCVPRRVGLRLMLACLPCYPTAANTTLRILSFDPAARSFTLEREHALTTQTFRSMSATSIAQFLIICVGTSDPSSDGPLILYYDVSQKQLNQFDSGEWVGDARYGGSVFMYKSYFYYAGGYIGSPMALNASRDVDKVHAFVELWRSVSIDHTNRTYTVGEWIKVYCDTCYDGTLVFRMSPSIDCHDRFPEIGDKTCTAVSNNLTKGAVFYQHKPHSEAFLCAAIGTCAVAANAQQPCTQGGTTDSFTTCTTKGCCWNSDSGMCFQPMPVQDPSTAYYFNVDPKPITIVPELPPQGPSVSFFRTKGGIVTICVCAAIIVILAVATVAYFQRKQPELEHPLENNSKYRLVSKLGQGGFGTVFLVQRKNSTSTEQYAMKYIACQSEEDRHYAMKEFELIRSAQGHPNMIRLIDMFMSWSNEGEEGASVNGTPKTDSKSGSPKGPSSQERQALLSLAPRYVCIVMEYYPEGDLSNFILDHHRQGAPEAFVLHVMCRQVCTLLQHLHALTPPIVHRDLKPENLLLAESAKKVVVTDFGLAQQVEKSYMTTRAGSLHYVAPECWKRHYTAAVDMWGLGCIMYAACTGRVTADTARVMFSDARERGFERDIRYDLRKFTPLLQDIVIGLLQTDPNKRMTSAQVLSMIGSS